MKINEVISPQLPKVGTKTKVGQVPYTFDGSHWINNQTKKPAAGLEQIQAWDAFKGNTDKPGVLRKIGNKIVDKVAGQHGQATRNDPTKSTAQKIGGTIGSALGAAYGRRKDRKAAANQQPVQQPNPQLARQGYDPSVDYTIPPEQRGVKPRSIKSATPPSDTWTTGLGGDGQGTPPPKARGGKVAGKVSQSNNAVRKRESRAKKKQQKQQSEIDSLG